MSKLRLELFVIQIALDSARYHLSFENLIDCWTLCRIYVEKRSHKCLQIRTVMRWKWLKHTSDYLKSEDMQTCTVKRWLQRKHLIEENSKRPHIRLEVVRFIFNDLWGQVIRCTNYGLSVINCWLKHLGNTEIPKFGKALPCKKDVAWFEITMQYLSVMDVLNC